MSYHLLWSLSRFFQQIFSADLLSRFSSADVLSRSSQQIFSQQIFSFAVVRGCHLLWSGVGGQLLSYHLLWSGVGGQLLSYHVGGLYCMSSLEGPFRGAFGKKVMRIHETFGIFLGAKYRLLTNTKMNWQLRCQLPTIYLPVQPGFQVASG